MSIYRDAVRKPITTILIFIGVMIFGFYSLLQLPVDLYPEMELPTITVMTQYNGANAADIETNISKTIEDAVSSVSNMKEVTSISRDNLSLVFIEFEWGTNLDEATNDLRDAINFVKRFLPDGAEEPAIYKFNSSMMPILFYSVSAKESLEGLEKILDEKVVNPLNKIDGIGSVGVSGAPTREILVEIDPAVLEAHNLTIEQIGNALMMENLNMPSGSIKMGKLQYPLRIEGEFKGSSEVGNIVVGNYNGITMQLKDIATIIDGTRESSIEEMINGNLGARMYVMKQSGGNTVKVAREVKKELAKIKKTLPADIQIETIFDSSEFINSSIKNLTETLLYAFIFVVGVVFLFLGRWRATFIIILTIPISLVVAFIYLQMTGNSINIISLSSLSIAIGMVVDDAIVVLENISKHIDRGSSPREAAIYATNEVWLAVIVTTLTVVAVFLPLTMVSGMTGILFKQLGWVVTITVVTSTFAAITLTPMLSSVLMRLKPKKEKHSRLSWDRTILPLLNKLDDVYGRTIAWSLKHKAIVMVVATLVFLSSFLVAGKIGGEFIPESDSSQISATIELQTGTRVEETSRVARLIEKFVKAEMPEVYLSSVSSGSDDTGGMTSIFQTSGSNIITYSMSLVKPGERTRSVWDLAEVIRTHLSNYAEIATYTVTTDGGMGGGMGGSQNVEVAIYGYDLEQTTLYAKEVQKIIQTIPGAREVKVSRENFKPELTVKLDRDKLALHGLTTAQVSTMVKNRVDGLIATRYRESGDEYNVLVRFNKESRNSITDLENISIMTPTGSSIKLKELGNVVETMTPPTIDRKRKQRIVTVTSVPYKVTLSQLAAQIQAKIGALDTPQGMYVEIGGSYEDMADSFKDIGMLALLSILLVFIVMASQFESFKMPVIIMSSILFIVPGVIFTLYFTGTNLSIIAALGAVLLVGIVVKNGIVLVDYINLMRDRGYELNHALVESGKSRLRPVLMTALTTMLGMLPMALSKGEGSEIWSPMGISVIGGLVFSTFVTMIVVPVIYAVIAKHGERDKVRDIRKKFVFMDK